MVILMKSLGAMKHLISFQNRLIYSTVADHHNLERNGIKSRFFQGKPFFLSWAGLKYYQFLCFDNMYLQWAFDETAVIKNHQPHRYVQKDFGVNHYEEDYEDNYLGALNPSFSVEENVENLIWSLKMLHNYDVEMFERANDKRRFKGVMLNYAISPVGDLIFKTSPAIYSLMRFRSSKASKAREEKVNLLLLELDSLLVMVSNHTLSVFGSYPKPWDILLEKHPDVRF